MEAKQKIESALKDALRSGNNLQKQTLRMILAAIKLAEVEKGIPVDDNGLMAIVQKEIKSRREVIADAQKANRPEMVADAEAEIKYLETFLPQAMPVEELRELARAVIAELDAKVPADMGKVMKALLPKIQGRAANDQVSQVVRQLLTPP